MKKKILVLRTARPHVLSQCLQSLGSADVTVLSSPLSAPPDSPCELLTAAAGPLRWARLETEMKRRLQAGRWDELVILHNRGRGYLPIYWLMFRIAPGTPTRIYYQLGEGGSMLHDSAAYALLGFLARSVRELLNSLFKLAVMVPLYLLLLAVLGLRDLLAKRRPADAR